MPRRRPASDPAASPGQTPKLTPAVRKAIVQAVAAGVPLKFAAEAAGVGERSLLRWLAAARRGVCTPAEWQLWQDIKAARAKGVAARLKRITSAAKKHWTADAWVLERTHPEHFSADRREVRELRRQLAYLIDRLARLESARDPAEPPPETADRPPPA